jgi:RimJ/RimL family protein N-acetyltransferase
VIERVDDATIGIIQATVDRDAAEGLTALLAWTVGCDHHGRGFASEAATALARWLSAWA